MEKRRVATRTASPSTTKKRPGARARSSAPAQPTPSHSPAIKRKSRLNKASPDSYQPARSSASVLEHIGAPKLNLPISHLGTSPPTSPSRVSSATPRIPFSISSRPPTSTTNSPLSSPRRTDSPHCSPRAKSPRPRSPQMRRKGSGGTPRSPLDSRSRRSPRSSLRASVRSPRGLPRSSTDKTASKPPEAEPTSTSPAPSSPQGPTLPAFNFQDHVLAQSGTPTTLSPLTKRSIRCADSEIDMTLREAFLLFDLNGDMVIDQSELTNVCEALGLTFTKERIQRMMREFDLDGNGILDFEEFSKMMKTFWCDGVHDEQEIREAFEVIDTNKDGVLQIEELRNIFRQIDLNLTKEEIEEILEEVDTDGNGVIDYNEFCKILVLDTKPPKPLPPSSRGGY
eukprot:gnl/Trimastix_PCT/5041.p1 GENE.gnl/Trimastix_PCT/5041~~gnl/Trimastix_PCT/5041.p1  ORF type:complete len:408 (+),score=30.76 gnl/Trimastix_PCT/5041:34-1224(+)